MHRKSSKDLIKESSGYKVRKTPKRKHKKTLDNFEEEV
jgi:hypothetical protein